MATEFLGLRMVVTIRTGERLCGSISGVAAGRSLTLSDVWSLESEEWRPTVVIDPGDIVEIVDATKVPGALAVPSQPPLPPPPAAPAFADPAILAFKPRVGRPGSLPEHGPETQAQPLTSGRRNPEPAPLAVPSVRVEDVSRERTPTLKVPGSVRAPPADGKAHVDAPSLHPVGSTNLPGHAGQAPEGAQKKKKRQRQPRQANSGVSDELLGPSPADQSKATGRGKGWRETPMLQSSSSFQPFDSLKRSGRGRPQAGQDNGWASEDVTDVQEMGDFDFEGGLAKFDKRTLFDQMRKEDQVDEADRLVSHNRLPRPKPGTAGGKNLHHSENVLDVPSATMPKTAAPQRDGQAVAQDFWNSEADDGIAHGGERLSGREHGSRQSSRRGESKKRLPQSRKTSAAAGAQGPPARVNSGVSAHSHQLRSRSRVATERVDESHWKQLPTPATAQGFYLLPSHRRLETVSALQMLNLENIAHNELGLTEDMMTENAGRGIAEVTLTALSDPAIKLLTGMADQSGSSSGAPSNGPPPTVVILAGNNKSGIRAVAGGRHLRNKGVAVLLCVVGVERGERELLEDMRQQVRLFRNFGGHVYTKAELFEHLRKASIPTLTIDTPRSAVAARPPVVTLIIDALLGLAISFEELRTGDQATVYQLIEWANRNEAFVLAVDVPTGIDPSSGRASIIDGNRLYVRPRYVVAMGAPKRGLLEAMSSVEADDTTSATVTASDDSAIDWKLFVADVGLGAAVWKKAGTKIRRGIDFDSKWVLEMRYRGATIDDEGLA